MFGIKRRDSNAPPASGIVSLSVDDYGLLLGIYDRQLDTREDIMALSKQVQDLLDRSKQESDLIKSMATSMKALLQQSADLQAKLDVVPVAPAPAMSQEDKDALSELAGDMDTAILTAQEAIPANVVQQGSQSSGGNTGIASQAQGGSISGSGASSQSGGENQSSGNQPSDGTATQTDPAQSTSQTQHDAAQADSQHQQDADASQQAKPLAGTGAQ